MQGICYLCEWWKCWDVWDSEGTQRLSVAESLSTKGTKGRKWCHQSLGPGAIWERRTGTEMGASQGGLGPSSEWMTSMNERQNLFLSFWLLSVLPKSWTSVEVRKQGILGNAGHKSQSPRGTEWASGRIRGSIWGQTGQEEPALIPWRERTVLWGKIKGIVLLNWMIMGGFFEAVKWKQKITKSYTSKGLWAGGGELGAKVPTPAVHWELSRGRA